MSPIPEGDSPELFQPAPDEPVEQDQRRERNGDDDDEGGQLRVVQEVVGAEDHGDVQERSFDLEKVVPKCKQKSTRNSRLKL